MKKVREMTTGEMKKYNKQKSQKKNEKKKRTSLVQQYLKIPQDYFLFTVKVVDSKIGIFVSKNENKYFNTRYNMSIIVAQ